MSKAIGFGENAIKGVAIDAGTGVATIGGAIAGNFLGQFFGTPEIGTIVGGGLGALVRYLTIGSWVSRGVAEVDEPHFAIGGTKNAIKGVGTEALLTAAGGVTLFGFGALDAAISAGNGMVANAGQDILHSIGIGQSFAVEHLTALLVALAARGLLLGTMGQTAKTGRWSLGHN